MLLLLLETNMYCGLSRFSTSSKENGRAEKLNKAYKAKKEKVFQEVLGFVRSTLRERDIIMRELEEMRTARGSCRAKNTEQQKKLNEKLETLPSVDCLSLLHYLASGGLIEDALFCVIDITRICNLNSLDYYF